MAVTLFQLHDWFSVDIFSSLAVRVVCHNMDEISSIDVIYNLS